MYIVRKYDHIYDFDNNKDIFCNMDFYLFHTLKAAKIKFAELKENAKKEFEKDLYIKNFKEMKNTQKELELLANDIILDFADFDTYNPVNSETLYCFTYDIEEYEYEEYVK